MGEITFGQGKLWNVVENATAGYTHLGHFHTVSGVQSNILCIMIVSENVSTSNIKYNGSNIDPTCTYRVAVPDGEISAYPDLSKLQSKKFENLTLTTYNI